MGLIARVTGSSLVASEAITAHLAKMRLDLKEDEASPLEKLLIRRWCCVGCPVTRPRSNTRDCYEKVCPNQRGSRLTDAWIEPMRDSCLLPRHWPRSESSRNERLRLLI